MKAQTYKHSIPVQRLEELLLPNLKIDFDWIFVVFNPGKTRKVFLSFFPESPENYVLKMFHIKENSSFLLQPNQEL